MPLDPKDDPFSRLYEPSPEELSATDPPEEPMRGLYPQRRLRPHSTNGHRRPPFDDPYWDNRYDSLRED